MMTLCHPPCTMMSTDPERHDSFSLVPSEKRMQDTGLMLPQLFCVYRRPLVALHCKPLSHRPTEEMQSAVAAWVAWQGLKLSLLPPADGMMTLLVLAVTPLACFQSGAESL